MLTKHYNLCWHGREQNSRQKEPLILCLQNTIIYAGRGEQKTVNHRTNLWLTETNGSQPKMWDHSVSQKKIPQVSGPSCCNCSASHSFIFKFLCIGTEGIALQGLAGSNVLAVIDSPFNSLLTSFRISVIPG